MQHIYFFIVRFDKIRLIFFETAHQEAGCISQRVFVKRNTQDRQENHWAQREIAEGTVAFRFAFAKDGITL
jgi:hypothetical protein